MLTAQQLPDPTLPWPVPMSIVAMMAETEQGPNGGVALVAYRCPVGRWTCGWGETDGVTPETVWTKAEADLRFCQSLTKFVGMVNASLTVAPNINELGAMASLAYNIGMGWTGTVKPRGAKDGFLQSSVRRAHNRGDRLAAARAFDLWNQGTINGVRQVLPGLVARRKAEGALYLTPTPGTGHERMPQAVEAESRMAASPIVQGGAVTAGAGAIEAVRQWGADVGGLKPVLDQARALLVDTLGVPPHWILPAVMIGAGLLVLRWRLRQRREGWA